MITYTVSFSNLFPPPIQVSGKVKDENGKPLEGATVKLKGSDKAVASNTEGNFIIEVPSWEA